jgi:arylsulfatase A-like enzyme
VRAVLLILDAMPPRHVGPTVTPVLHALGQEGGAAVGRSVLLSSTYPNHATFATGAGPEHHPLLGNWVVTERGPRPAQKVGPSVPTLFDACRDAGRSSAAVVGDQHLIAVMGAANADEHWPPAGVVADGVTLDGHGYPIDAEVVPRLLPFLAAGGPDLVVGHLNAPDTAAHMFGPDSEAAREIYGSTDACVAELVDALRSQWDDTVLIVVSDHDQETASDAPRIDLWGSAADRGLIGIPEGNGGVVWGADPEAGAWLDGLAGVGGHVEAWSGARVVWCEPGRRFAWPPGFDAPDEPGDHGGQHTRNQVAIVAGGHPAASTVAASIVDRRPEAADWAPTIADLLAIDLPRATGRSLLTEAPIRRGL